MIGLKTNTIHLHQITLTDQYLVRCYAKECSGLFACACAISGEPLLTIFLNLVLRDSYFLAMTAKQELFFPIAASQFSSILCGGGGVRWSFCSLSSRCLCFISYQVYSSIALWRTNMLHLWFFICTHMESRAAF